MSRFISSFAIAVLVVAVMAFAGAAPTAFAKETLVVYTYSSFASGPAQAVKEGFVALHPGTEIIFVSPGSGGETLARILAEQDTGGTQADVFIGLSDTLLPRALARDVLEPLDKSALPNLAHVPAALDFDETGHAVPFDNGYITIIYDSEALSADDLPSSLDDLADPRFAKQLIAIAPRTSSVGHAF